MLILKPAQNHELILMHDTYFDADEPDAPDKLFHQLSTSEQEIQLAEYRLNPIFSVYHKQKVIGFLGLFPDQHGPCIYLFYLFLPEYRGRGHFIQLLQVVAHHCETHFPEHRSLRAITRQDNRPSVRGLIRAGYRRSSEPLHTEDENISYLEFLLPL